MRYRVAHKLGCHQLSDMDDMPAEEYVGWIAHFGLEVEESK
jgi:hypothetical protein